MSVPGKVRSHRQRRAWIHAHMEAHSSEFGTLWEGQGSIDPRGKENGMPDFQAYLNAIAKVGTWRGAVEILAWAQLESLRVYVLHEDGTIHLFNAQATGKSVAFFFHAAGHYEVYDDFDELEWTRQIAKQEKEGGKQPSKTALRGGGALSDFASSRPEPKAKGQRRRSLSDFASNESKKGNAISDFASRASQKRTSPASRATSSTSKRCRTGSGLDTKTHHQTADLHGGRVSFPSTAAQSDEIVDDEPFQQVLRPRVFQTPPWRTTLIRAGGHAPVFVAHPGKVLRWKRKCDKVIDADNSFRLSLRRATHVNRKHKGEDCPPLFRATMYEKTEVRPLLPGVDVAWQCAQCGQGTPRKVATRGQTFIAAEKHLKQCPGAAKTMKANFVRLKKQRKERGEGAVPAKSEVGKAKCLQMWRATRRHSRGHDFAPVALPWKTGNNPKRELNFAYACKSCTRLWAGLCDRDFKENCGGQKVRRRHLKRRGQQWKKWRRGHQAQKYAETVNLTKEEAKFLESQTRGTTKPALQECVWFRNLCEDGDVESNPGPRTFMLSSFFFNAGGLDNTYQALSEVVFARQWPENHRHCGGGCKTGCQAVFGGTPPWAWIPRVVLWAGRATQCTRSRVCQWRHPCGTSS